MISNNKSKLLTWVVVFLLITNTVFTTVMWMRMNHHARPPQRPDRQKQTRGRFLIEHLSLDSAQQVQFNALAPAHFTTLDSLNEQQKMAKSAFFSLLQSDSVSTEKIMSLAAQSAKIEQEIDIHVFNGFKRIKAICTPAQIEKLYDALHQLGMLSTLNDKEIDQLGQSAVPPSVPKEDHPDGPPPPRMHGRPDGPPPGFDHPDGPPPPRMHGRPDGPPPGFDRPDGPPPPRMHGRPDGPPPNSN